MDTRNFKNLYIFKKKILSFIKPRADSIFGVHNPLGIKLLCRLRIGLSHLREHKFKHGFLDSLNPICACGQGIETTAHYFLHCGLFNFTRTTLFNSIRGINPDILNRTDIAITKLLLYGDPNFSMNTNKIILKSSIEFLINTNCFDCCLF